MGELSVGEADRTPLGRRAMIACRSGSLNPGGVAYLPDQQRWRQYPGRDLWVGAYLDDMPRPEELERPNMLAGYPFEHDGATWIAPTARSLAENDEGEYQVVSLVSCAFDLDTEGNWVPGDVSTVDADVWAVATKWWDIFTEYHNQLREGRTDCEIGSISFGDENDLCVRALSRNYLISPAEVAVLQLLNQHSKGRILAALVDLDRITLAGQKKTASVISNSNGGVLA